MIPQSRHIIPQISQHPKLCRLRFVYGLNQGSHGKIAAIQHQGVRIFLLLFIDQGFDPCKSANFFLLSIYDG